MSEAVIIQVADAVTEEIRGLRLSEDFTARRSYGDWHDTVNNLDGLMIDVVPATTPSKLFTRGSLRYLCTVVILVRRLLVEDARIRDGERVDQGRFENAVIDKYVKDLQDIHEYFAPSQSAQNGRRLASMPGAAWQEESVIRDVFSQHMLGQGQFSGRLFLTYLVSRAAGS